MTKKVECAITTTTNFNAPKQYFRSFFSEDFNFNQSAFDTLVNYVSTVSG